jgi:hypothetical protein
MPLSVDQVVSATGCPVENVSQNWPLIVAALEASGINSDLVQIAAAATVAVETGTFAPRVEKLADPAKQGDLHRSQMRYYPWIGRGFVQITWEKNYRMFGALVGVDLIADPAKAADPLIAAHVLAAFFERAGVAESANAQDWRSVRRRVNGGYNGWDHFNRVVCRLTGASV